MNTDSKTFKPSSAQTSIRRFSTFAFTNRRIINRCIIWVSALLIIASCLLRFFQFPTFWLDEAWIAVSLKQPSLQTIFTRLEMGLYFPRLYMCVIALFREIFGYKVWTVRLLPTICFIIGTIFWLRLLAKRANSFISLYILGGVLVLGSSFWLEESIQLKQYTFDVVLGLIPFLLDDTFFEQTFADGKSRTKLLALALPCALSYTYPVSLLARIIGWYLLFGKHKSWRLNLWAVGSFVISMLAAFAIIWFTDYRYNFRDQAAYLEYWKDCIIHLSAPVAALRLIGNFLWGWYHGHLMPLVIIAVMPLQAIGMYWTVKKLRDRNAFEADSDWGTRTLGSVCLLAMMVVASAILHYPICAGRVVLFTQVHTQILLLEGAAYVLTFWKIRKSALGFLFASIAVVIAYSTHRYISFIKDQPPENLRPVIPLIDPTLANTIWVHPCSIGQVRSLPEPLPVQEVILKTRKGVPEPGRKVWILWTHLGDDFCKESLEELRTRAKNWQVVHESSGRGLVLAEY